MSSVRSMSTESSSCCAWVLCASLFLLSCGRVAGCKPKEPGCVRHALPISGAICTEKYVCSSSTPEMFDKKHVKFDQGLDFLS